MTSFSSAVVGTFYSDEFFACYPKILFVITLVVAYAWYSSRKDESDTQMGEKRIPGPKWTWPVLGYLPNLGRFPHKKLTALRSVYGDVFQIQMGSWPTVVINGIDTIKQALYKQAEEFAGRPGFFSFGYLAKGKSMGFADYGPRWKVHRKIAQNALAGMANDRNNPMEVAVQEEARVLIENLSLKAIQAKDGSVDPHQEIYLSVGNIICALCFGKRYKRDDPDFVQLIKMNSDFMTFMGAGNPVDILPWMRHFTHRSFKTFLGILETMDNFCERKRDEHVATYDGSKTRDITDALLKATYEIPEEDKERVGLTDEHILITVQELIGAGFDTNATTLEWAILFMTANPEFQKMAQEEIDQKIGRERSPSMKDMGDLPITEAIMYETMRLSCIFPFALPHSTTKDTYLNGYFIPAKTLIFVNMWSANRDENKFSDPDVFNPKRFLTEDKTGLLREELEKFQPFGVGRRRCPGEPLGRMEIFIFIASLLQKCYFAAVPGEKYSYEAQYGLTLKPQSFKVKLTRRN